MKIPSGSSSSRSTATRAESGAAARGRPSEHDAGLGADWAEVDARSREALWLRQFYVGFVGFLGGGAAGLFYVIDTWNTGPHRGVLAAVAGFMIVQALVVWSIRKRFVTPAQRSTLFITSVLFTYVMVAVGSVLDGGIASPVALMWVLPVLYMLMGYSRRAILICGAIAISLYVVVAALTPGGAALSTVVMQLAILATALCMVFLGAAAREDRERILQSLRTRLANLATVDELTGCTNVRAFARLESTEVTRAARLGHHVSLLAVDVDHFKRINDTRGHLIGDHVLRTVADTLRTTARRTDIIGRLGGDEFIVLCPETDPRGCAPRCARCPSTASR